MFLYLGHTSEKINLNFAKLLSNLAIIKILVKNLTWHSPHLSDHFLFLHQYELYIVLLNFDFIILIPSLGIPLASVNFMLSIFRPYFWKSKLELHKAITWHSPHFSDHFLFLRQYELYIVLLNFDFIICMPSLGIPLTSVNFMLSIFRPEDR